MHFKHAILLAIAAWLGDAPLARAQEKIKYQDHVSPLFESACNSCHNADKAKGGLDLSSYQNMLKGGSSGGAVEPGNPDGSLLYKLVSHQEEPFMPHKKDKLADAQLALVAKWITGGLLETKSSTAKKKKKKHLRPWLRGRDRWQAGRPVAHAGAFAARTSRQR